MIGGASHKKRPPQMKAEIKSPIVRFEANFKTGETIEIITGNLYEDFIHLYLDSLQEEGVIDLEEMGDEPINYKAYLLGHVDVDMEDGDYDV